MGIARGADRRYTYQGDFVGTICAQSQLPPLPAMYVPALSGFESVHIALII